uniref:Uncharacterized protein n=1 Tax=Glossina pallidipes TaxID=7398 RepID=A0A1B0ADF1_GLOPL
MPYHIMELLLKSYEAIIKLIVSLRMTDIEFSLFFCFNNDAALKLHGSFIYNLGTFAAMYVNPFLSIELKAFTLRLRFVPPDKLVVLRPCFEVDRFFNAGGCGVFGVGFSVGCHNYLIVVIDLCSVELLLARHVRPKGHFSSPSVTSAEVFLSTAANWLYIAATTSPAKKDLLIWTIILVVFFLSTTSACNSRINFNFREPNFRLRVLSLDSVLGCILVVPVGITSSSVSSDRFLRSCRRM